MLPPRVSKGHREGTLFLVCQIVCAHLCQEFLQQLLSICVFCVLIPVPYLGWNKPFPESALLCLLGIVWVYRICVLATYKASKRYIFSLIKVFF